MELILLKTPDKRVGAAPSWVPWTADPPELTGILSTAAENAEYDLSGKSQDEEDGLRPARHCGETLRSDLNWLFPLTVPLKY